MRKETAGLAVLLVLGFTMAATALRAEDPPAAPETPQAQPAAPAPEAAPAEDAATEKAWSLEVGVDDSTKYLFRGVDLLAGGDVLWPHATLTWGNFSAYTYAYWGDMPDKAGSYSENDFGLDYTFTAGRASITLGALTYQYSSDVEKAMGFLDTYEVYGIVSFDTLLAPTITYYHDVDAVDGGFLTLGVSHGFELTDKLSVDLSGTLGLDFGYNLGSDLARELGVSKSRGDFDDFLVGADFTYAFDDAFSAHALVQESYALDVLDDIGQDDVTVVTAGLAYSF